MKPPLDLLPGPEFRVTKVESKCLLYNVLERTDMVLGTWNQLAKWRNRDFQSLARLNRAFMIQKSRHLRRLTAQKLGPGTQGFLHSMQIGHTLCLSDQQRCGNRDPPWTRYLYPIRKGFSGQFEDPPGMSSRSEGCPS